MATPVISDKVFTPEEYIHNYTDLTDMYYGDLTTVADIRNLLDDYGYQDTWDFPVSEIDELMESGGDVVLVYDGTEARWFETITNYGE